MAFITNAELISRIGGTQKAAELTTEAGSTPDTTMIDAIIAEVEADVLAALRTRTAVAIALVDHPQTWVMLAGWVMAISIYKVALRRPPVPDDWKSDRDKAVAKMELLREGKLDLPDVVLNTTRTGHGNYRETADPGAMI